MKKLAIGFIGGGRITRIFLQAFVNKELNLENIVVYDIHPEILGGLKRQYPQIQIVNDLHVAAKQEDMVFIALHPPVIMETLGMIKNDVSANATVVSLAPKISMEKIHNQLGICNIIRMIPNATSYISRGYNPISFFQKSDSGLKDAALDLLMHLGHTFEVEESKLEGYAILSAMLPTYFWFQWEALKDIGTSIGLNHEESREAIYETLLAAMEMMFKTELPYEHLADLIPVKPIGEHELFIKECFQSKLLPLFEKIKS